MNTPASIPAFPPEGVQFLVELSLNNDREWFQSHKDEYDRVVRGPMVRIVERCYELAAARELPLGGDPAKAVFRVYRDVRFSNDKRPYKTHIGAAMTRPGEKWKAGVLYFHIDPRETFVAAGFHMPEPDLLNMFRHAIFTAPGEFWEVVRHLNGNGLHLADDDGSLKRLPREFANAKGHPAEQQLLRKSFTVSQELDSERIETVGIAEHLIDFFVRSRPLLEYGWQLLDRV